MARDETEGEENDEESKSGFYAHYDSKEVLGKGMSSTVRRCIEKESGTEYAVKILDITTERSNEEQARELKDSTLNEIRLLRLVGGHKNISS
uniref:Protein kinase domain-containing protein n=1 Tax=Romanomermis culicivorax TaxID=13658 RepID=A0A915L674_ROMCU